MFFHGRVLKSSNNLGLFSSVELFFFPGIKKNLQQLNIYGRTSTVLHVRHDRPYNNRYCIDLLHSIPC